MYVLLLCNDTLCRTPWLLNRTPARATNTNLASTLTSMQVWDFQRSAEMRDTEGGASRRSVLEQVAKLRTYLAQQA